MNSEKKVRGFSAIIFALVLIIIPGINVIDITPDFIAYFIILAALSRAKDTAPYFAEASLAFKRLAVLSIFRIPALMIVYFVRGKNFQDHDITVLMTLVFTVAEVILLVVAINNLFAGLFYLGERTTADKTVLPFKVFHREMHPETLKIIAVIYAVIKCTLCFLPELLRLTRTVEVGNQNYVQHSSVYYPYATVLALLVSLTFGIFIVIFFKKYLLFVGRNTITQALDEVEANLPVGTIDKKKKMRAIYRPIYALIVAAILSPEVIFDNFHNINILPHTLYALALTVTVCLIPKSVLGQAKRRASLIATSIFCATSLVAYIVSVNFLTEHTYRDLVTGSVAKREYIPVMLFSAIEVIALIVTLVMIMLAMKRYVLLNTGISPEAENYSFHEREYHSTLLRRIYILFGIGMALGVLKFVDMVFKYNMKVLFTNEDNPLGDTVIASSVPWFSGFVFIISLLYIGYSIYCLTNLKEEVAAKYSDY